MIKRIIKKGAKKLIKRSLKKKTTQTTLTDIKPDHYINEPLTLKAKKKTKLHITHWNINGLRAVIRKETIHKYLSKHDFDIICLSETKIDKIALHKEKINENALWYKKYNQYYHFSTMKRGYSGVSIFSKQKPKNKFFGMNKNKFDKEGRVLTVEYKKFYLVNVYVPNSKPKLQRLKERVSEFDTNFREFITNLKKKKNVIILGDMNVAHKPIDLKEPKKNKRSNGFTIEERDSFDLYLENGFVDRWRELNPEKVQYSWWSYLSRKPRSMSNGWRIDYCLVDREGRKAVTDVVIREDVFGSDHCPVEVFVDLELFKGGEDFMVDENGVGCKIGKECETGNENEKEDCKDDKGGVIIKEDDCGEKVCEVNNEGIFEEDKGKNCDEEITKTEKKTDIMEEKKEIVSKEIEKTIKEIKK